MLARLGNLGKWNFLRAVSGGVSLTIYFLPYYMTNHDESSVKLQSYVS